MFGTRRRTRLRQPQNSICIVHPRVVLLFSLPRSLRQWTGTDVAPSSSGLGRHPLKVKIVGSNPTGVTTQTSDHMGMWCRGLTCDPVKVETAGSNPVIPATEPPMFTHRWFSFLLRAIPSPPLQQSIGPKNRSICRSADPSPARNRQTQRTDDACVFSHGGRWGCPAVHPRRAGADPFSSCVPHLVHTVVRRRMQS